MYSNMIIHQENILPDFLVQYAGPLTDICIIVFMVTRHPVHRIKMISNVLEEIAALVHYRKRYNIACQYQHIAYWCKRVVANVFMILPELQVQV